MWAISWITASSRSLRDARSQRGIEKRTVYFAPCDVAWFFWALAARFGVDAPAVGAERCWAKVARRRAVWAEIFTAAGTNYERPEKVAAALEAARREMVG